MNPSYISAFSRSRPARQSSNQAHNVTMSKVGRRSWQNCVQVTLGANIRQLNSQIAQRAEATPTHTLANPGIDFNQHNTTYQATTLHHYSPSVAADPQRKVHMQRVLPSAELHQRQPSAYFNQGRSLRPS